MTILIIIAVVVVIFIAIYNSLVRKRNETENAFAAIDVMLKKRYDLIPNLVTTVKEYAEHEKSTFAQITEMRNKSYASFSNQDKENLDSAFSQACTHFFAIAENYPQLNTFSSGEMTGEMPVGIRTLGNDDVPYWPQTNNACYKEVWVTSAGKWLSLIAEY